jgi:hypothetical protein
VNRKVAEALREVRVERLGDRELVDVLERLGIDQMDVAPAAYRLPLLWLDWSGARVGSVDTLTAGDYDERDRKVRLRASTQKSRAALWVELPDVLADAIEDTLGPREDRDPDAPLFPGVSADRLRTPMRGHAGRPAFRPSRRTTCAIGGSACCIGRDAHGRRSGASSASASSRSRPTPTRMFSRTAPRSTSLRAIEADVPTPCLPQRRKAAISRGV